MKAIDKEIKTHNRFIDEAGDCAFYDKYGNSTIGNDGVSKGFGIGMLKIKEPLKRVRAMVAELQSEIIKDAYFNVIPSVKKRIDNKGFFFHATDDTPEIRSEFFRLIKQIDCSFEMVAVSKSKIFYNRALTSDTELYAHLLAHLLQNKLETNSVLILNIAMRGKTTNNITLTKSLELAKQKLFKRKSDANIVTDVKFNIGTHYSEPILNIVDYFCWAIQRVFEKGEARYYDYLF